MGDYKKLGDTQEQEKEKTHKMSALEEIETQTGPEGLTSAEAQRRLERDG